MNKVSFVCRFCAYLRKPKLRIIGGSTDLLRQVLTKQMISTTRRIVVHTPAAMGTIQVQHKTKEIKLKITVVKVILSDCLMWNVRYDELLEILATSAISTPKIPKE